MTDRKKTLDSNDHLVADSIAIHSAQANYYKYRTPYIPKLFSEIANNLDINSKSILIDLGCGTGEVASQLAKYAGKVYGYDGSSEMLSKAHKAPNISYHKADLNLIVPSIPQKANHLFFGRSIHWFPSVTLERLSNAMLKNGGAIVVCSTQWNPVGDWGSEYQAIVNSYIPRSLNKKIVDFTGKTNLTPINFMSTKKIAVETKVRVNINSLIGHTLSTTYRENLINLTGRIQEFSKDMNSRLQEFLDREEIILKVTSWANIYKK